MLNFRSVKIQLIIFLVAYAVYLAIADRSPLFLLSILLCLIAAIATEAGVRLMKKKQRVFSDSAVITGLIIGFVLSSGHAWYVYIAASALAISSKYVIRVQNKHIFNPAAFGILSVTLLLAATTQWKGTYQWYILVPAGLYFTYRIRKMELLISYAVTALGLWGIQALLQQVNVRYIFGYLSYFFIFIMLIEPKTSPIHRVGRILFGIIVAVSIFIFTEAGVGFDVELGSLLIGNAAVPLLNRLQAKKGE